MKLLPISIDFFENEILKALSGKYGIKGEIVLIKLIYAIANNGGYYIVWDEVTRFKFVNAISEIPQETIDAIIKDLLGWGWLDADIYSQSQVLTGKYIQNPFFKGRVYRKEINYHYAYEEYQKHTPKAEKPIYFSDINIKAELKSDKWNNVHLLIAYRFWRLWFEENSNHAHLKKAKVTDWVTVIRRIIEVDKQSPQRLIGIIEYFKKCQQKDSRFRDFWFKTIRSVASLRGVDKNGVAYIDHICDNVNAAIEKYEDFNRLVWEKIERLEKEWQLK